MKINFLNLSLVILSLTFLCFQVRAEHLEISGSQNEAPYDQRVCSEFRIDDSLYGRYFKAILNSELVSSYANENGGIKAVWPHVKLCATNKKNEAVFLVTLAFAGPGGDYVSWGWNYCQVQILLQNRRVFSLNEVRCDSPMDH